MNCFGRSKRDNRIFPRWSPTDTSKEHKRNRRLLPKSRKQKRLENKAAILIQKWVRGMLVKKVCPICLQSLWCRDSVTTICNHQFHRKCIEKWCKVNKNQKCPICREYLGERKVQLFFTNITSIETLRWGF